MEMKKTDIVQPATPEECERLMKAQEFHEEYKILIETAEERYGKFYDINSEFEARKQYLLKIIRKLSRREKSKIVEPNH
jgi:hypothetical protein